MMFSPDEIIQAIDAQELRALAVYDAHGLIPVVVQNACDKAVLMVAWMDAEALDLSLNTGETWFWSRSRSEHWHKGATSGNTQRIVEIRIDCDGDTLLVLVEPAGPACHTGHNSCFYRAMSWSQDQ
jgi:phosphoribosyl-AMP cyclohydrolase